MKGSDGMNKKCKWCTEEGWCELKDGIADDDSCNGSKDDMLWCNIVANNAEYDGIEIEDVVKQWYSSY